MADETARPLSPPLPPEPALAQQKAQPSRPLQAGVETAPSTPLSEQFPSERKRVDSLGSPSSPPTQSPILQQQQPIIKDAVNHAANNVFEHSSVTNQLDPAFIKQLTAQVTAQVTAEVLQNLQAAGATPTPSTFPQQPVYPPPPPPAQSYEPRSPTQNSIDSGARFTPPTPDRVRGYREERTFQSTSPEPGFSDVGSNFSRVSHDSVRSRESYKSSETPRPSNEDQASKARGGSYASRRMSGMDAGVERPRRQGSVTEEPIQESVQQGSREPTAYGPNTTDRQQSMELPREDEETPLEKSWQPLFINGNPTQRLSQFLRGLALHIIEEYQPKCSIVITPEKMLQFLNETRLSNEHYPWDIIFGGKLSPNSISQMFQKLQCQHHFIQDRYDRPPTIPSLTPGGFDYFMTCLIQAYPDAGFERMAKATMTMPISNADDKSERFPKELSRRLLPREPNIQAQQRMIASLNHEPYVISTLKGSSPMPPPPASAPPTATVPPSSFQERERKPYSHTSSASNAVDDEDLAGPQPTQFERERKPYTGKEGAGKVYGGEDIRPPLGSGPLRQDPMAGGQRGSKTNSGIPPQAMYNNNGGSDPMNIAPRPSHRMSTSQAVPPPGANTGYSRSGRRNSPPMRNPFARSEPEFSGSMPNSQYASNAHRDPPRDPYYRDLDDDAAKRYRSRSRIDRNSNPHEDDPRGYNIPSRNVPIANGYDYGGGPIGGPPVGQQASGTPVGSYPTRRPPVGNGGGDERRRSMYGQPPNFSAGDGGTDGYGSFANGGYSGPPPQQQPYGSASQH